MIQKKHILFVFVLLFIGAGCDRNQKAEEIHEPTTVKKPKVNELPISESVKIVDPDSLVKPKTIPLLQKPRVVPARNNKFIANTPTIIPNAARRIIITPGENGVPLPDTVSFVRKVTTVRHPMPSPASRMDMKPEAIMDIQYLSVAQGLKNPWIECMLEDRRGNFWFKNDDYLSRYDGQQFFHYSADNGFYLDNVSFMLEDSKGNLWLGGNDNLSCYDGKQFTRYVFEGFDWGISPTCMIEDPEGKLWFGTRLGLLCYDPAADLGRGKFMLFTSRQGLLNRFVRATMIDQEGKLWISTRHGLSCYDGQRFTNYPIEGWVATTNTYHVLHMIQDRQGILWLGTRYLGLIRFDPAANDGQGSYASININVERVIGLAEDHKGNIWVGGYRDGLFCLLRDEMEIGNSYLHFTQKEGLKGNFFRAMHKDSHGNIWIGGQNGGVNRLNIRNPIRYYNQQIGLKGTNVDCIFEDSRGFIWFGLQSPPGVLKYNRADGGTFTHYGIPEGLDEQSVTSIIEDHEGNIWMGSWGNDEGNGATRLNRSKEQLQSEPSYSGNESLTFYNEKTGLKNRAVLTLLNDSRENLWIGSWPGVTYYERDDAGNGLGRFFHFNLKDDHRRLTTDLLEDRRGDVWISSSKGVYKFDLNLSKKEADSKSVNDLASKTQPWSKGQSYIMYTTEDGLSNDYVRDIIEDSQGNLWFATLNGLSRYDPMEDRFYAYGNKDGLLSDNILAMAEDQQKNLWILSQSGIQVVDIDMHFDVQSSGRKEYQFITFLDADGFRTIDAGFKNIWVTGQNELWWATGDGVASLDLNNYELPKNAPKINLTTIEIDQSYLDYSGILDTTTHLDSKLSKRLAGTFDMVTAFNNYPLNLKLPYDLNHLTFHFSAIDWASPHQLQYSYMMEGLDKTWSEPSSDRKADYRNLPSGKYIYKVKAIGMAQKWSEPFEYVFTIHPPWWYTWWAYVFYGLCFLTGIIVIDRFQRKRLIAIEREKTKDKELAQAKEIEKAYHDLKSTQSQLIQAEKMASLGELTAGIAHEIQNPLNFVNNFSEVNAELAGELNDEIEKGNLEEAKDIAKDIINNEQKIKHHGKRAEAIVNGMLQHSRSSTGQKEPTDVNALADEYLRLAYHGLRAKDKTFNADFSLDLDKNLPKIKVIPQDIGRVLLNLINNAFYAVDKKAKRLAPESSDVKATDDNTYKPLVTVFTETTKSPSGDLGVMIKVKDNGEGIPEQVRAKIFQPFFTTKPTGSGTGLGLSLSYDIIKAHDGELKVDSKERKGTELIIHLPIV